MKGFVILSLLSSHQILIKLHPQSIMTMTTTIDSNLLVLPQEDLNSKNKGNLILLKLPIPINQLQTCRMKILASSHSSALICNDNTTYSLSALGTSNALVLVPPVQQVAVSVPQNGKEQDGDSNSTESPRKKSKPSPLPESRHSIRHCRLVQPGGSGIFPRGDASQCRCGACPKDAARGSPKSLLIVVQTAICFLPDPRGIGYHVCVSQ
jgi:hypothetical protein